VIAGDDGVDFVLGFDVALSVGRTVVEEGDGILCIVALQRKEHTHRLNRDKDARIGAVVSLTTDLAENANDFKLEAVEQNVSPHSGTPREDVFH